MQSGWMGQERSVLHCSAGFRVRQRQVTVFLREGLVPVVKRGGLAEETLAWARCRQSRQSRSLREKDTEWGDGVGDTLALARCESLFSVTCRRPGGCADD